MFELKTIHEQTIPTALDKAVRYRLLNEPGQAESICRDILRIDPDNRKAIITLLLALTDQFPRGLTQRLTEAKELAQKLISDYERAYYSGIVLERRAKCLYHRSNPGRGPVTYHALREAMALFEQAEALRPPDNDDAILRWNACVRLIMKHPDIGPEPDEDEHPPVQLE